MELFYEEKIKAIISRARARWHEHGEKTYEIFFFFESRKEKSYQKKSYEKIKYQWFHHHGSIQYLQRTTKLLSRVIHE